AAAWRWGRGTGGCRDDVLRPAAGCMRGLVEDAAGLKIIPVAGCTRGTGRYEREQPEKNPDLSHGTSPARSPCSARASALRPQESRSCSAAAHGRSRPGLRFLRPPIHSARKIGAAMHPGPRTAAIHDAGGRYETCPFPTHGDLEEKKHTEIRK